MSNGAASPPQPRVRRPAWLPSGYVVLLLLVAGFASLNRTFAYIKVGPFYITEVCLGVLVAFWTLRLLARPVITLPPSPLAKLPLLFSCAYLLYGTVRLIPDLVGGAGLESALRNFGIIYYAVFAPLAYAAVAQSPVKRSSTILAAIVLFSTVSNFVRFLVVGLNEALISLIAYTTVIGGHEALFAVLSAIALLGYIRARPGRSKAVIVPVVALVLGEVLFIYFAGQRSGLVSLVAAVAVFACLTGSKRPVAAVTT